MTRLRTSRLLPLALLAVAVTTAQPSAASPPTSGGPGGVSGGQNAGTAPTPTLKVKADELNTISFARLVVRVEESHALGVAHEEFGVQFLEELRRQGYPALGAESLVFGEDRAEEARFLLGGTLSEFYCGGPRGMFDTNPFHACRVGIQWELKDRKHDQVVYRVMTRAVGDSQDVKGMLVGALRSLLARPKFVEALKKQSNEDKPDAAPTNMASAKFVQCTTPALPMPSSAEKALQATVVVEAEFPNRHGVGSGAIVSPDGFVMTAAHVVTGASNVRVRLRNGEVADAAVIRQNAAHDVALLKFSTNREQPCLSVGTDRARLGDDVYAIGSPTGKELAFSLSRGIVSGYREHDGVTVLQTDATINPGNSGGPLVDAKGRWVAVVSFKRTGEAVEGLGFGIAAADAMSSLSIAPGLVSDSILRTPNVINAETPPAPRTAFEDTADVLIFPEPPKKNPASRAKVLLWSLGTPCLVVGGLVAATSYASFKPNGTQAEYNSSRTFNDVAWVLIGVGAAAIVTALVLPSPAPPTPVKASAPPPKPRPTFHAGITPFSASFMVRY